MMTRRERLLATLRGEPVDRPAVNFYEIGGFAVDPDDPDPFNIYNDPSWRPLIDLAEAHTDLLRMRAPKTSPANPDLHREFFRFRTWIDGSARFTEHTVHAPGRGLRSLSRRDAAIDTVWQLEHLLKNEDDVLAYLQIPEAAYDEHVTIDSLLETEKQLGDAGLLMIDTPDPLCLAAALFPMEDYTLLAFSRPDLFTRLLERFARVLHARTEAVTQKLPGRLWRIFGPEYAGEPFLPPRLFDEYVVRFTGPMVRQIQATGGFARVHCHGRVRHILPKLVAMGAAATDPLEPPPQGDITLAEARELVGPDLAIFGNLEVSDIENAAPPRFEQIVRQSLGEARRTTGRGFVLMPSAAPYGRTITPTTLANYRTMIRLTEQTAA